MNQTNTIAYRYRDRVEAAAARAHAMGDDVEDLHIRTRRLDPTGSNRRGWMSSSFVQCFKNRTGH